MRQLAKPWEDLEALADLAKRRRKKSQQRNPPDSPAFNDQFRWKSECHADDLNDRTEKLLQSASDASLFEVPAGYKLKEKD